MKHRPRFLTITCRWCSREVQCRAIVREFAVSIAAYSAMDSWKILIILERRLQVQGADPIATAIDAWTYGARKMWSSSGRLAKTILSSPGVCHPAVSLLFLASSRRLACWDVDWKRPGDLAKAVASHAPPRHMVTPSRPPFPPAVTHSPL